VRDQTNVRKIKHRKSVRSGTDNADAPEASAEAMKAKFAAADADAVAAIIEDAVLGNPATKAQNSVDQEPDEIDRFVSKCLDHDLAHALYKLLSNDQDILDLYGRLKNALGLDDDDIQEAEANPPPRRRRKPKFEETSLGEAVSDAFAVLEELAGECREVVDNAPEG